MNEEIIVKKITHTRGPTKAESWAPIWVMFENTRVQSSGRPLQAVGAEVVRGEGAVEERDR